MVLRGIRIAESGVRLPVGPYMNQAFIFDMDGTLIDSERTWQLLEKPMLERVLGKDTVLRLGSTVGLNASQIFERVQKIDPSASFEDIMEGYAGIDLLAVYESSQITSGADELISSLDSKGYKIGLVTQSSQFCVELVLKRLSHAAKIAQTLSLFRNPRLMPKPSPDGYIEILRAFNAEPKRSFILEDSNAGIQSGKSAGAFVIGFRGNLLDGYQQTGADAYVDAMQQVTEIIQNR